MFSTSIHMFSTSNFMFSTSTFIHSTSNFMFSSLIFIHSTSNFMFSASIFIYSTSNSKYSTSTAKSRRRVKYYSSYFCPQRNAILNLKQIIKEPTRITDTSQSLIDVILVSTEAVVL